MAHTIKLEWIRRILSSSGSGQSRLIHDAARTRICNQGPLRRLMRLIRNSSGTASGGNEPWKVGRKPQNPGEPSTERPSPFRVNTSPNAHMVSMHPLVKGQDKKRLPFEKSATMRSHSALRRGEQLARTLRSQDTSGRPGSRSTIPLKILEMVQRERRLTGHPPRDRRISAQIDSMRTRNMERMVRESQARLLTGRVKELFGRQEEKEVERKKLDVESFVPEPKIAKENRSKLEVREVVDLLKRAISLALFNHKRRVEVVDVKVSRMQTKLEWNASSMETLAKDMDRSLQTTHAYHMRVRCAMVLSARKSPRPEATKANCQEMASNLIQEEQRRLDTLRAERVPLKLPQDDLKLENIVKKLACPVTSAEATDLDINSPNCPKSFFTKVADNPENNFPIDFVENPDVFSHISKPLIKK
ncbi:uncharacterized protein LOC108023261 [Drosophila biarmipes]|uniref:uncharacterized protein LOC108023261 n=1 Tax=Drosophila biarmipes TaxID=125945 RepID=UPI0007E75538|nr:uncharacterized protein LOC108023261 [Drosophila biarmipes]